MKICIDLIRQKRRTRATIAKEKGLEPLAEQVWVQAVENIEAEATQYFSEEHELQDDRRGIAGVNDIIAEWISDDPAFRDYIRETTWKHGVLKTEVKDPEIDDKEIYKMYYEYSEAVRTLVSHRILAINRGEKEDVLRVSIEPPLEKIITYLKNQVIRKISLLMYENINRGN